MDGLANAENVGALMRNCVASGVQALLAGETCSSLFLRRTVRNSMGALFKLPVLESTNVGETLRELRANGLKCVAAHPCPDGKVLSHADVSGDCCIVFGSEGRGNSAGERGGFSQRQRSGGGVSLRSEPAAGKGISWHSTKRLFGGKSPHE